VRSCFAGNLASVCLPRFVDGDQFDFRGLHAVIKTMTRNLNRVIDVTYYPLEDARRSNLRHRPIGIGVQGLADVFALMRVPFDSEAARTLNLHIFETMYHAALEESCQLAQEQGVYSSWKGSPAQQGLLQFDLWSKADGDGPEYSMGLWNWGVLRKDIALYGLRNSLLLAPMPTASTAQINGNAESTEPYTSNIYTRKTLAGDFVCINTHLVKDLLALGLWNKQVKDAIIRDGGSVQRLENVPSDIKALYKTAWELKQRVLIDLAADRGRFICQSQSLNLFFQEPTFRKLTSAHMYSWKAGLKGANYYIRTQAAAKPVQVTLAPDTAERSGFDANEPCLVCSS
jgi:ribonucleoside-diphosphate reductase alpha subunit